MSSAETGVAYRDDLSDIKQYVVTIRLQYCPVAAMRHLVDVGKSPSGYRVFTDEPDVPRTKPMTGRRQG